MPRFTDARRSVPPSWASPRQIEPFFLGEWSGGWQPDIAESQLAPNQLADVQNVEFTEGFGLKKRRGYEIITDSVAGVAEITSVHVGTSDGGTFTLSYGWPLSGGTGLSTALTAPIDFDASAAEVAAAIEAMSDDPLTIDVSVTGTGSSVDPWLITVISPISAYVVSGDGAELENGTLTVAQSQQGLAATGIPGALLIKSIEVLEPGSYPRYTQLALYINETDGAVFFQRMGELLIEEETPSGGTDLERSGYSLGPWVRANRERPYSVQAAAWGRGIYITSQRTAGTSGSGTTLNTHDGTADTHTQPLHYNVDTDVWSTKEPHELDGSTSGFPTARCLISAYDRMFAANLVKQEQTASDYRWRSRVYWSDAGTAETWQATSYLTVGSEDDSTDIVNLTPFREQIMIFKEQAVWTLVGTDEDTFALYQLNDSAGAVGTYAVAADQTHVYFFDSTQGVIRFDGVNFENVSDDVNGEILGNLNPAAAFKSVMWVDENQVYLCIPTGSFTELATDKCDTTYVFHKGLKVWSKWTGAVVTPPVQIRPDGTVSSSNDDLFQNEWYGAFVNVQGIARMHTTNNDNGSAIDAYFETAWFNPGTVGDKHRIRRLEVVSEPDGGSVDLSLYRNFQQTAWKTGTFTPTGSLDGWHEQQPKYDGEWFSWLKVRLSNDDTGETFQVNGLGCSYSSRPLLRNDLGIT